MRFLVIEDNRNLASAVIERLQLDGHAVDHADTLKAAQDCIAAADYDLILLDIMLPEGDGRTFKHSVRGTHVSISQNHMKRYLDEFTFRANHRSEVNQMFDRLIAAF